MYTEGQVRSEVCLKVRKMIQCKKNQVQNSKKKKKQPTSIKRTKLIKRKDMLAELKEPENNKKTKTIKQKTKEASTPEDEEANESSPTTPVKTKKQSTPKKQPTRMSPRTKKPQVDAEEEGEIEEGDEKPLAEKKGGQLQREREIKRERASH